MSLGFWIFRENHRNILGHEKPKIEYIELMKGSQKASKIDLALKMGKESTKFRKHSNWCFQTCF
jgi:hypothetical protein